MTPEPTVDAWRPKLWGRTRTIGDDTYQAEAVPGGFSSRHRHPGQTNAFFVLSGCLRVEIWRGRLPVGVPDSSVRLHPADSVTVPPGVWHRFVALEPTAVIELYERPIHPAEGPPPPGVDIERYDEGGVGDPKYGILHD